MICCSMRFSWESTIELPLNAPTGKVIASGSIRNPMPMIGRLEMMVNPMPASCSRRTALLAPSVNVLSLVSSVPSTSETTRAIPLIHASCTFSRCFAAVGGLESELAHDLVDDCLDRGVDRHCYGIFSGFRRLKRFELAVQ